MRDAIPHKVIKAISVATEKEKKGKEIIFKKNGEIYEATLTGISKVHRYDLHVNIEIGTSKILADFGVDNIH